GFGESEGRPGETGLNRDAAAAWRYITETRGIPPEHVVLFGRSLGGSVAAALAARTAPAADRSPRQGPAGLIVESSFTSVPDLAARHYPIFPVRLLARHRHPTLQYVRESDTPVLVAHSRTDEIIPWSHGEALLATAGDRGSFLELQGGHNDGFMVTGAAYVEGLRAFLQRVLP
ncbi:MAG: alpha/beta hydrolase, partial [Spirochaetaceae bacterium]